MLPKTNIKTTLVRDTLGSNSLSVGELCSDDNINIWSLKKPVHFNGALIPDSVRNTLSGFVIDGMYWKYTPPRGSSESPYRLGDFREYQHDAELPTSSMQLSSINKPSIDDDADIVLDSWQTELIFNVTVRLPKILYMIDPTIRTVEVVLSTLAEPFPNTFRTIGEHTLTGNVSDLLDPIEIECTQTQFLPQFVGDKVTCSYFIKFGNYFLVSGSFLRMYKTILKRIVVNPEDPNQWRDCTVSDPELLSFKGEIVYNRFEYFYADGKQPHTRFRLTDFVISFSTINNLRIEYYDNGWKKFGDISQNDIINKTYSGTLFNKSNISSFRITKVTK